jgi:hypothetical protein
MVKNDTIKQRRRGIIDLEVLLHCAFLWCYRLYRT